MNVRYRVDLSQIERTELRGLLSGGKHASRRLKRGQILRAADAGASDEEIARSVGVGGSTVYRTKRRFVEGNLERALSHEPRPGAERKLSGKEEALLVATACASPPEGRARWTLELLAGAMGSDEIEVESWCQRTDGVDRVFSTSMDWLHAERPSEHTLAYSVETLLFDIVARCLRYVGEPVDVRSGLLGKGHVWAIISSVGLEMDEIKKENESWRGAKIVTQAPPLGLSLERS